MTATAQQLSALAKGNDIRLLQAALKRQVRAAGGLQGRLILAGILERDPADHPELSMTVRRFVLLAPRFGERALLRVLRDCGIYTGDRRVRDLSVRQRLLLAERLRGA